MERYAVVLSSTETCWPAEVHESESVVLTREVSMYIRIGAFVT